MNSRKGKRGGGHSSSGGSMRGHSSHVGGGPGGGSRGSGGDRGDRHVVHSSLMNERSLMKDAFAADGVYSNPRLMYSATSMVGCPVRVQLRSGKCYEGVLKCYSAKFELMMEYAHEVIVGDEDSKRPPSRDKIVDKLVVQPTDVVTVTATSVDLDYALNKDAPASSSSSFVDSAISGLKLNGGDRSYNDDHQRGGAGNGGGHGGFAALAPLQPWDAEGVDDICLEDTDGDSSGWDPNEMFRANAERFGVESSYDSSMEQYTMPLLPKSSEEFKKREEVARKLAEEIEGSVTYKDRIALENDEGEVDEEDKYSAVVRPEAPASTGGKYIPPAKRERASPATAVITTAERGKGGRGGSERLSEGGGDSKGDERVERNSDSRGEKNSDSRGERNSDSRGERGGDRDYDRGERSDNRGERSERGGDRGMDRGGRGGRNSADRHIANSPQHREYTQQHHRDHPQQQHRDHPQQQHHGYHGRMPYGNVGTNGGGRQSSPRAAVGSMEHGGGPSKSGGGGDESGGRMRRNYDTNRGPHARKSSASYSDGKDSSNEGSSSQNSNGATSGGCGGGGGPPSIDSSSSNTHPHHHPPHPPTSKQHHHSQNAQPLLIPPISVITTPHSSSSSSSTRVAPISYSAAVASPTGSAGGRSPVPPVSQQHAPGPQPSTDPKISPQQIAPHSRPPPKSSKPFPPNAVAAHGGKPSAVSSSSLHQAAPSTFAGAAAYQPNAQNAAESQPMLPSPHQMPPPQQQQPPPHQKQAHQQPLLQQPPPPQQHQPQQLTPTQQQQPLTLHHPPPSQQFPQQPLPHPHQPPPIHQQQPTQQPPPLVPQNIVPPEHQKKSCNSKKPREEQIAELKDFSQNFKLQEAEDAPKEPEKERTPMTDSTPENQAPQEREGRPPSEVKDAKEPSASPEESKDAVASKSKLNPNAKEFTFNPMAKSFVPRPGPGQSASSQQSNPPTQVAMSPNMAFPQSPVTPQGNGPIYPSQFAPPTVGNVPFPPATPVSLPYQAVMTYSPNQNNFANGNNPLNPGNNARFAKPPQPVPGVFQSPRNSTSENNGQQQNPPEGSNGAMAVLPQGYHPAHHMAFATAPGHGLASSNTPGGFPPGYPQVMVMGGTRMITPAMVAQHAGNTYLLQHPAAGNGGAAAAAAHAGQSQVPGQAQPPTPGGPPNNKAQNSSPPAEPSNANETPTVPSVPSQQVGNQSALNFNQQMFYHQQQQMQQQILHAHFAHQAQQQAAQAQNAQGQPGAPTSQPQGLTPGTPVMYHPVPMMAAYHHRFTTAAASSGNPAIQIQPGKQPQPGAVGMQQPGVMQPASTPTGQLPQQAPANVGQVPTQQQSVPSFVHYAAAPVGMTHGYQIQQPPPSHPGAAPTTQVQPQQPPTGTPGFPSMYHQYAIASVPPASGAPPMSTPFSQTSANNNQQPSSSQ